MTQAKACRYSLINITLLLYCLNVIGLILFGKPNISLTIVLSVCRDVYGICKNMWIHYNICIYQLCVDINLDNIAKIDNFLHQYSTEKEVT